MNEWHKWFAWYPVYCNGFAGAAGGWTCLRTVYWQINTGNLYYVKRITNE